jgi:hypothetical protein
MTPKEAAKVWMKQNHPDQPLNKLRVSKYYPEKRLWFFTFPSSYFEQSAKEKNIVILLQDIDTTGFIYLKVPFSFFHSNQDKFDVRCGGDKFDLHISAKTKNWLEE